MLLVLAMLMTMFVGVGTASAAIVDYSAFGVTTVQTGTASDKTLGSILVDIDDVVYLGVYENWVTLKLPSGVSITDDSVVDVKDVTPNIAVDAYVKNSSTVDIKVQRLTNDGNAGKFTIYFEKIKVQSGSGNLDVTFLPQSGSILPGGTVTIANIVSKGATQAVVTSVKSLGEGGGAIDTISIAELSPGVFKNAAGKTIKLELPAGVKWNISSFVPVVGAWEFADNGILNDPNLVTPTPDGGFEDNRFVNLRVNEDGDILYVEFLKDLPSDKAGRIDIGGNNMFLEIDIDEDDAKKGDIKVKISSKYIDGVTKQDLVIAKYGDYDVTLAENEVTELVAGKDGQELGSFYIQEALAGSLIKGRTLTLQLPSGVKWN
ncbi:MAG: hypothetical protein GX790_05900, partial [Syntrophomonadaceae bacterium]|nr:hypothetical protein [Syntrophomonadaceae bacterium]